MVIPTKTPMYVKILAVCKVTFMRDEDNMVDLVSIKFIFAK